MILSTLFATGTARYLDGAQVLAASLYPDNAPTAPSTQTFTEFGSLVGDMKWIAGAAAIIGIFIVVIMGVVAHKRGESMIEAFGGFVKILGLLTAVASAVSIVSAFI